MSPSDHRPVRCRPIDAGLFRPISKLMGAGATAKLRFASGRPGPAGGANSWRQH
ncbi:hypothetical protein [Microbulbifer halophilus]|uniref:hypothetical protein n=1 Tax=Microbulbifer halophilus TaxID=453963 RepID=UPI00360F9B49